MSKPAARAPANGRNRSATQPRRQRPRRSRDTKGLTHGEKKTCVEGGGLRAETRRVDGRHLHGVRSRQRADTAELLRGDRGAEKKERRLQHPARAGGRTA